MKASNPLSRIRAAVSPGRILCRTWDYSTLAVQKVCRKPEETSLPVRKNLVYTDNPDWTRDCKLDLYQAPKAGDAPRPLLIHLHGTAFDGGGKRFCVPLAEQMARSGTDVLAVDYGLSPQYNFKESLQHLCEALHWVVSHAEEFHWDLDRILLSGDSSGAYYVLYLLALTTDPYLGSRLGLPVPALHFAGAYLQDGVYDLEQLIHTPLIGPLAQFRVRDVMGARKKRFDAHPDKELCSPGNYVNEAFPAKILLAVSPWNLTGRGQAKALQKQLEKNGISAALDSEWRTKTEDRAESWIRSVCEMSPEPEKR